MNSLKFWLIVIGGLPIAAAVCLVFWVGVIGLFEGSDPTVAVAMVIVGAGGLIGLRVFGQRLRRHRPVAGSRKADGAAESSRR